MALPVELTLDEARKEVLLGINLSDDLSASTSILPQIDSQIRRAQTLVYNDADWVPLNLSVQLPMTAGQEVYDWPDDVAPGKLDEVIAIRTDTDPNRARTLVPGIRRPVRCDPADMPVGQRGAVVAFGDVGNYTRRMGVLRRQWRGDRQSLDRGDIRQLCHVLSQDRFYSPHA